MGGACQERSRCSFPVVSAEVAKTASPGDAESRRIAMRHLNAPRRIDEHARTGRTGSSPAAAGASSGCRRCSSFGYGNRNATRPTHSKAKGSAVAAGAAFIPARPVIHLHRKWQFGVEILRHRFSKPSPESHGRRVDLFVVFTQADRTLTPETMRSD